MARMADQECEVELLQDLGWYHGWVVGLGGSVVGVWCCMVAIRDTVCCVAVHAVRADSFFDGLPS